MNGFRSRQRDLEQARVRLAEADRRIVDLAARRARIEAEIELYVLRVRVKGAT